MTNNQPTLAEALSTVMRLLSRGVADRRSPFHEPTLATIGFDGAPSLRTVILRAFDPASRTLRFHTDRRAAKIAELNADPRASVHAYDSHARIQLRLAGQARILTDGPVLDAAWAARPPATRQSYAVPVTPGTNRPDTINPGHTNGRENFAVLTLQVDQLEYLELARDGHRRARFTWTLDGPVARWLVP